MPVTEMYGLGGHRKFDPRNLDFSITDKLKELEKYDTDLRRAVFGISRGGGITELRGDDRAAKATALKAAAKHSTSKHHWAPMTSILPRWT